METIIPVLDMICLIALAIGIGLRQKRRGKLTEKQMSSITLGYGTFFVLTTFGGIFWETHSLIVILVGFGMLLLSFVFGYPFTRWLYKKFYSPK